MNNNGDIRKRERCVCGAEWEWEGAQWAFPARELEEWRVNHRCSIPPLVPA